MKQILITLLLICAYNVHAQIGIGTPSPKAMLHIKPDTSVTSMKVEGLQDVADTRTTKIMVVDNDGIVLKKEMEMNLMPSFFYMPSVVLPTNETSTVADTRTNTYNVNYTPSVPDTGTISGVYEMNLYDVFQKQFKAPVASSDSSTNKLDGFVLNANQYEYYVIYADNNVFPHEYIRINNNGVLTYRVNRSAIIRNGAFMNIVLKVK